MEPVLTLPQEPPELTLGWGVLAWCSEYLRQPTAQTPERRGNSRASRCSSSFTGTPSNLAAASPTTAASCAEAKAGEQVPVIASLALAELCGPVRFSHLDPDAPGGVIGRPVPAAWVQLAGSQRNQTTNTMSMVTGMVAESPILNEYGLDVGLTRIYTASGGRLEADHRQRTQRRRSPPDRGLPRRDALVDRQQRRPQTRQVIRRNLSKSRDGAPECSETTNAHAVGLDSVAERSYQAHQQIVSRAGTLRADPLRLPRSPRRHRPRQPRRAARSTRRHLATPTGWTSTGSSTKSSTPAPRRTTRGASTSTRSPKPTTHSSPPTNGKAASTPTRSSPTKTPSPSASTDPAAAYEGKPDATALIGCRVHDGHLFEIGVWEAETDLTSKTGRHRYPKSRAAIANAFRRYTVLGFYADPGRDWRSYVNAWEATHGNAIHKRCASSPTTPSVVDVGGRSGLVQLAVETFEGAVRNHDLTHDGSYRLTQHILNSRREVRRQAAHRQRARLLRRKVDAAVAAVLAWQARCDALAAGLTARRRARKLTRY